MNLSLVSKKKRKEKEEEATLVFNYSSCFNLASIIDF
jgi:hypothetical protein